MSEHLPAPLSSGEPARLLPVVKDSSLEDRASSILLATLLSVPAFRKAMFDTMGQSTGKQSYPALHRLA